MKSREKHRVVGNFFAPHDILSVQEHMNTDDQLVLEFQQGLRDAFREIFERYREPSSGRSRGSLPASAKRLKAWTGSAPFCCTE
jgi:hypothetical protein